MSSGSEITPRFRVSFLEKIVGGVCGESDDFPVFFGGGLENAEFCCGAFVVSLWWIAW
jgi:hypothetical protein